MGPGVVSILDLRRRMTDGPRVVRRNQVDERIAVAIGVATGIVAALAGARPTGRVGIDVGLTFVACASVAWAAASAPWWSLAVATGVGAVVALDLVVGAVGAVAFVAALAVGVRRQDRSATRAVLGGIAANVLIRSEVREFLGLSAVIGIGVCSMLLFFGIRRRHRTLRRRSWLAVASLAGFAILALVGAMINAASARPQLSDGESLARSGIDLLGNGDGDYDAAADRFDSASERFAAAHDELDGSLALPSRLIPAVAQNVRAVSTLSAAAATTLAEASDALRQVDPDRLRITNGVVDIAAIREVEPLLVDVRSALDDLRVTTDDIRSPWLVSQVDRRLDGLVADLDEQEPRLRTAIDAVTLAPQLLGGDGERRYLVLFTSPAEARGLGGFIGNYAEMVIDDGRITVGDFDRRSDLEQAIAESDVSCEGCPDEFLRRYGRFGFTSGIAGSVSPRAWSNITMSAHFPYVAETAAVLYPQSGGRPIDGVMVMDPYVVAALMQYTGSVDVPQLGVSVAPDDAADFILRRQYVLAADANDERIDALETLGNSVIGGLLTRSLPAPTALADDLGPLVQERRLLIWTDDADEQALLDQVGLLGSIPPLGDSGGFSVSITNAGANKIDVFLDRDVEVEVVDDAGGRRLVAAVTLTNDAPRRGLPDYVIANAVGLPRGTNRMFITFYGPPGLATAERDGEPIPLEPIAEAGWIAYGAFLDVAPGESTILELVFDLSDSPRSVAPLTLFAQPLG